MAGTITLDEGRNLALKLSRIRTQLTFIEQAARMRFPCTGRYESLDDWTNELKTISTELQTICNGLPVEKPTGNDKEKKK